uniref:Glycosyltransferase 2-like domain-containing protein n=1 Tax=Hyaloperonospora arabidopsidis (strain Emoy2) TaxID=559515 RepID=M4BUQ5_HYAAE
MPSDSLRTSVGSTNHAFSGETCIDLYAERVMTPRLALFSVLTGLVVCTLLFSWHRCRNRRRRVNPLQEKVVFKSLVDLGDHMRWKRWLTCFLASTVAWITIFLWCTSSMTTTNMNPAQPRPRMVFSFTTTSQGIDKMQPTLDGLVHQTDDFDAIYVIIPRTYQDRPVTIPSWLLTADSMLNRTEFHGLSFATGTSSYHPKVRIVVLDTDLGPASKVLGTLLVEQDPDTIIVYGDDDRVYPPQLRERVQHYTQKYPTDAIAVLGGWISAEDGLYCGRSLAVGVNRVSFVGGAGGVAVKRKFFGMGEATMPAFQVRNLSKACFLGDDYYLSHLLSRNSVRRRLVFDSCWNVESLPESFSNGGLSGAPSTHPGGANVEHYQQCIRELGENHDLSGDGEFGSSFMFVFSRTWGLFRGFWNLYVGGGFVTC